MTDEIIIITPRDFKTVKCRVDMHGDRIIGYVSEGFVDSLNKLINEKNAYILKYIESLDPDKIDWTINQLVNNSLRKEMKILEEENKVLRSSLDEIQNNLKKIQKLFKRCGLEKG